MKEEKTRENTLTITIARNSDGEIMKVIQGTSIFAGIADAEGGGAISLCLNEGSNGVEMLGASSAAVKAIEACEKENKAFRAIRKLFSAFGETETESANDDDE